MRKRGPDKHRGRDPEIRRQQHLDTSCVTPVVPEGAPHLLRNNLATSMDGRDATICAPTMADSEPEDSTTDCKTAKYTLGCNRRRTSNAGTPSPRAPVARALCLDLLDHANHPGANHARQGHFRLWLDLAKTPDLKRTHTRAPNPGAPNPRH